MQHPIQRGGLTIASIVLWIFASCAYAQSYPNRPIRLVVPFASGGSMDITARILAQKLSESLGQPVIVDNRAGASGTIGSDIVAKAAPDGYTLMITSASHTVNPSLFAKLPYDTVKDFTPITLVLTLPMVLVAHPTAQITSLNAFLATAKAKPGSLSYGSSGNGGAAHLVGELVKLSAGIDMVHVPYKGGGPAVTDVLGGQIPLLFNSIPPLLPYIQSGRVIPIAVTSAKRSPLLPNVPTFMESGLPAVELVEWAGVFAPGNTPKEIVATIRNAVVKALQMPDVSEKLAGLGAEPVGSTPEEFVAFINVEIPKVAKIVKAAGARID
jgi:tripartite-type tricarboxylate transporter receptor subunit TctC